MMLPFAVWHEGVPDAVDQAGNPVLDEENNPVKQARWVLGIEGNRFLLCDDQRKFYWREMSECEMLRIWTPDFALQVLPLQIQQQQPQVLIPRADRRNDLFGRN